MPALQSAETQPMLRCHAITTRGTGSALLCESSPGFFFRVRKLMDISVLLASITPLWVSCYRSQEETGIGSDTGEHEIECTTTALDEARARRVHRGWSPAVLLLVTLAWYLAVLTTRGCGYLFLSLLTHLLNNSSFIVFILSWRKR